MKIFLYFQKKVLLIAGFYYRSPDIFTKKVVLCHLKLNTGIPFINNWSPQGLENEFGCTNIHFLARTNTTTKSEILIKIEFVEFFSPFKILTMLKAFLVSNGIDVNRKTLVGMKCVSAFHFYVPQNR